MHRFRRVYTPRKSAPQKDVYPDLRVQRIPTARGGRLLKTYADLVAKRTPISVGRLWRGSVPRIEGKTYPDFGRKVSGGAVYPESRGNVPPWVERQQCTPWAGVHWAGVQYP